MIVEFLAHPRGDTVRDSRVADDLDADVAFLRPVGLAQPAAALATASVIVKPRTPSASSSVTSARSSADSVTIVTMRRV